MTPGTPRTTSPASDLQRSPLGTAGCDRNVIQFHTYPLITWESENWNIRHVLAAGLQGLPIWGTQHRTVGRQGSLLHPLCPPLLPLNSMGWRGFPDN